MPIKVLVGRWQLAPEELQARHAFPRDTGRRAPTGPLGSRSTESAHSQGHSQGCSWRTCQAMWVPSLPPLNPAIPDRYRGARPGTLTRKHAGGGSGGGTAQNGRELRPMRVLAKPGSPVLSRHRDPFPGGRTARPRVSTGQSRRSERGRRANRPMASLLRRVHFLLDRNQNLLGLGARHAWNLPVSSCLQAKGLPFAPQAAPRSRCPRTPQIPTPGRGAHTAPSRARTAPLKGLASLRAMPSPCWAGCLVPAGISHIR